MNLSGDLSEKTFLRCKMRKSKVPICDILLAFGMHKPHEETSQEFCKKIGNKNDKIVNKEGSKKQKKTENKVAQEKENLKQKKCDYKIIEEYIEQEEEEYVKQDEPISAYEKMVKSNIKEKMAFLKSLKISEIKNDVKETTKDKKKLPKPKMNEKRNLRQRDQGRKTLRKRL